MAFRYGSFMVCLRMVIEANERVVTVAFDSAGIKKLAKDVATVFMLYCNHADGYFE